MKRRAGYDKLAAIAAELSGLDPRDYKEQDEQGEYWDLGSRRYMIAWITREVAAGDAEKVSA